MRPLQPNRAGIDRLIWGLSVVVAGILAGVYQLGYLSQRQLLDLWPLILFSFGLCYLFGAKQRKTAGGLFLLAGVLLLIGNHLLPGRHMMEIQVGFLGFRLSWPLLLVIAGIGIAWRERSRPRPSAETSR